MPNPSLRRFSFLECLTIFQFLATKRGQEIHDGWLRSQGLPKRTLGTQQGAELYKGWFFWMYLNGRNPNEMKIYFNLQGWPGNSERSDERWFRSMLNAWSWPIYTRDDKHAREKFVGFILEMVPKSELKLQLDNPKISRYITFPEYHPEDPRRAPWTLLPKRANQNREFSVGDLEQQAFALYNPDGPCQPVLTPRHCAMETLSPGSMNSSVVTSPNAWSPYSPSSSFTSVNPNTPSQVWSPSSSPLDCAIPAKKFPPIATEKVGSKVLDPPHVTSSGVVLQAVDAKLSEHLDTSPEASASGCHSTPSMDNAPRRLLTYGDGIKALVGPQDPVSISQQPKQVIDVVTSEDHTEEVGSSNSSTNSVSSGAEASDDDWLPGAVEDNSDDDEDFRYALTTATVDAIHSQSQ